MKMSELCGKCNFRLVVHCRKNGKPRYAFCIERSAYEEFMRHSSQEAIEKTFAFSPQNEKFVNPATEFHCLFGMDMERNCEMEFRMTDKDIVEMIMNGRNGLSEWCPYYAEMLVEHLCLEEHEDD
jgi:hypothetical protein